MPLIVGVIPSGAEGPFVFAFHPAPAPTTTEYNAILQIGMRGIHSCMPCGSMRTLGAAERVVAHSLRGSLIGR